MNHAPSRHRLPILVTRNPDRAEEWLRALDAAHVDALVEMSDAQIAEPGRSPLVGAIGGRPIEFVHVVTVRPSDRDRAMAALIDAGWDGREGSTWRQPTDLRGLLIGTAAMAGGFAVFLLMRAVLG